MVGYESRTALRTEQPPLDVERVCASLLAKGSLTSMLRALNERTRFRFTGLYRVDPPLLRNLFLYDRENPTLNVSGGVSSLEDTYCALVWSEDRPFATPNSASEPRLAAHAARERVQSYCGVPIRSVSGLVWGTLCHHDVRPRLLPRWENLVLERVAALLAPIVTGATPVI